MAFTTEQKKKLIEYLLQQCQHGNVQRGGFKSAMEKFHISKKQVYNIWQRAKLCMLLNKPINIESLRKGRCEKKGMIVDIEKAAEVSMQKRTIIRSLAIALGASKSSIQRLVKKGFIKRHSNAIKPSLTDANKKRLVFCMNHLKSVSSSSESQFEQMFNTIHVDEKWFYITKCKGTYYILPHEKRPYRTTKSKRYIQKVMFLVAVARPRWNEIGECIFDGKIGMFPFLQWVAAKRKTLNRDRGTLELKPVTVVNTMEYRKMLINKALPPIVEKWPRFGEGTIYIQQDNAKSHIHDTDPKFRNAVQSLDLDLRLINQPQIVPT